MPRISALSTTLCLPLILGAGLLWGQAPAEATPTPEAVLHLMARRDALGLDADHAFRIRHAHSDHLGQSHSHVRQFYQGVRVWGGEAITHQDRRGLMQPITNALYDNIQLNVRPSMGENEALHIAQLDLNPKGAFALTPTVELVVYPEPGKDVHPALFQFLEEDPEAPPSRSRVGRYALAYHLHTELDNAQDGLRHTDFLVDAHTGAILKRWETLHTTATSGTGKSQYSGVVALDANATGSGFELRDLSRGKGGTFGNNVVIWPTAPPPARPQARSTPVPAAPGGMGPTTSRVAPPPAPTARQPLWTPCTA
jgi:Zn-dependent metalloprotease